MEIATKGRNANSQLHLSDCDGKAISDLAHLCTYVLQRPNALFQLFKIRPPLGTKPHLGYRFKRKQVNLKIAKVNLAMLREHCDLINRPIQQLRKPGDCGNCRQAVACRSPGKRLRGLVFNDRSPQGLNPLQSHQHQVKSPIACLSLVPLQLACLKASALIGFALKSVGRHTDNPSSAGGNDTCNCSNPVRCTANFPWDSNAIRRAKNNPAENGAKRCTDQRDQRRVSLRNEVIRNSHAAPCGVLVVVGILT